MAIDAGIYINNVKVGLKANKTFDIFFYRFKYNSKSYKGLINLTDKSGWNKRDRVAFAESELLRIKENKKNNLNEKITLDDFMLKHFKFMNDTNWKKTKKSHYERYIGPYIGKKQLADIVQLNIKDIIKKQEVLGLAPRTVKQTLEVLNPAYREAIANRIVTYNPCQGIVVKLPKTKKIVSNATSLLIEVYNAIKYEFKDDPFYQSFYMLALQGRRKGEIINLKWKDVSFAHSYYILRDTKSGETQKMFLPDNIKLLMLEFKDDNEYVFTSPVTGTKLSNISGTVSKLKKRLNLPEFGIHYLRNVISSAMAEQGVESIYQSGALGHNDPNTITKYLSMNYLKGSQIASGVIADLTKK